MSVTVTLLYLAFLPLLLYILQKLIKHVKIAIYVHKLPGPKRYNIILGNLFYVQDSQENIFKTFRRWGLEHYPIYKMWLAHMVGVSCMGPEDFELILSNMKHIDKGPIYHLLHRWLGTGLLTSAGHKWQLRRKILTPAFHFNILQQFLVIFNEEACNLVDILKHECQKPCTNINPLISQFALRTIAETAMGTKFDFKNKVERTYLSAIHKTGSILVHKVFRPYYYFNEFFKFVYLLTPTNLQEVQLVKILHNFTSSVIKKKEKDFVDIDENSIMNEDYRLYGKKKRLAMLDLLLSIKKRNEIIDDKGIQDEVNTFMFEGHDTTAISIGFTLMLLANHRDVQETILSEMRDVLKDVHKKPSYNDLQELHYMERCIKESLRLYPSVSYISRQLGDDLITAGGYRLLKDTIMHLHIYDLHHNPKLYPDPEKFDPDRFLPENCQTRHPFAYVPFSAGPRNCIGQKFALLEIKAVLCGVLANFILEPVDTPESLVVIVDIVLRTKNDIRVKFVPRLP